MYHYLYDMNQFFLYQGSTDFPVDKPVLYLLFFSRRMTDGKIRIT